MRPSKRRPQPWWRPHQCIQNSKWPQAPHLHLHLHLQLRLHLLLCQLQIQIRLLCFDQRSRRGCSGTSKLACFMMPSAAQPAAPLHANKNGSQLALPKRKAQVVVALVALMSAVGAVQIDDLRIVPLELWIALSHLHQEAGKLHQESHQ